MIIRHSYLWVSRLKNSISYAPVKFELEVACCSSHVGGHLSQLWASNSSPFNIWLRVQEIFFKWAGLKKRGFYRFHRIFYAQKQDCRDKNIFGCLEETSPYLRKPFPRKILFLNPLTHKYIKACSAQCMAASLCTFRHISCLPTLCSKRLNIPTF